MPSQDQHFDRRSFLKVLGGALGGFVREFQAGLGEPSAEEQQELAAAQAEVDALRDDVMSLAQAAEHNQQATLDMLARIADQVEQINHRVAALEEVQKPGQAARWRAILKRLGELALLLVGPTAVAAALRDALVENELYPVLRDRLLALLSRTETVVGPLEATPVTSALPAPVPTPAELVGTPTPAEIEASRSGARSQEPGPIKFDWVTIPAGEFLMGSDPRVDSLAEADEQPQHRVYLPEYRIASVPVTNRQFAAFVEARSYRTTAEREGWGWAWSGAIWGRVAGACWYLPTGPGSQIGPTKASHPVVQVSWEDAAAFCRSAGVRLPTEAEWEKAARGADGRIYPWGNRPPDKSLCNYSRNVGDTTPVGRYPAGASPYRVLDMAGNVWEWCSDWFDQEAYQPRAGKVTRSPTGPASGPFRVLRSGSWLSDRRYVRCACRCRGDPGVWNVNYGFRVAGSSLT